MSKFSTHLIGSGLIVLSLLAACARIAPEAPGSKQVGKPKPPVPAATEPAGETPATSPPLPEPETPTPSKKPAARPSPPAVSALVEEADAAGHAGQWDLAAATLERAIRIQPRNAELWHRLANTRLQQNHFQAAEDLAKKSNVFAAGDRTLIQQNWRLIAEARRGKGDNEGAHDAEAKASR